jgi:TonB family protein
VAAAPEPLPARRRPAAILFKPRPRYTAAALEQKIEGEVWLEVLFPAAGAARVLRLLRGLGFGLDEAAAACVAELRFRPAEEDGHPVDSAAVVRLRFELAEAAPSRPVSANTAERRAP